MEAIMETGAGPSSQKSLLASYFRPLEAIQKQSENAPDWMGYARNLQALLDGEPFDLIHDPSQAVASAPASAEPAPIRPGMGARHEEPSDNTQAFEDEGQDQAVSRS